MLTIKPIFFFKSVFIFNWRIIALQYCVGFCHTLTWTNRRDTYISTLVNLPPTSLPIPPSMSSWSTGPSTLYHSANSHWLSVLHVATCMFLYYPLISTPPSFPHYVQKSVLHICVSTATSSRLINAIFLDSIYTHLNTIFVFSFLTSPCIISSRFIYLIRTDSNAFLYMAE